ncbi:MAG: phosphate ABC transporter ATP-binding protein [Deltaproteobacteria bacterium]|nr:phosphate ABC transporter ATP-binding protein [Deltaproteobacteria bacterium]
MSRPRKPTIELPPVVSFPDDQTKVRARGLNAWFGDKQVLFDVSIDVPSQGVTAIIGPSGCGKSTFVRCVNRMHELVESARLSGEVSLDGESVYGADVDPVLLRRRVGMVFQKPNPFPTMSIRDNVLAGLKLTKTLDKSTAEQNVEQALSQAALWNEVRDRLDEPGGSLSGGQQQRLCIARALAVQPDVLLMDEPCSALDPIATAHIEDLLHTLKEHYTIVIVTHNMQQAARVSDMTAFFLSGELIEFSPTSETFTAPRHQRTEEYITGKFG